MPPNIMRRLYGGVTRLFESASDREIRRLEESVYKQTLHAQKRLLETTTGQGPNWLGNVVDYDGYGDDASFYAPYGDQFERIPYNLNKTLRGDLLPVYITWYGLKIIRDISRRLYVHNEYAIGAIENRCSYICGKGFQHKLVPKNDKDGPETKYLCALGQLWIDSFMSHQRWNEREQEAVKRCDRDGEMFMRFFHVGRGRTEVRFIEPEWVQSPADTEWETYGVICEPYDVEDILGYYIFEHPPYEKATFVDAAEVLHIKINSDSTSKRGLPTFYPVRKNLERAEKLLRNMSILAQVQATFAMIRKHKQYSVTQMTNARNNQADVSYVGPFGNTEYSKGYRPGTIIDAPENVEYDFPSSTVNAGNLVAILQAELRAAAQRVNMPEFMFSGDSSNANMASAFIAESPFVKKMEELQAYYAVRFGDGGLVKVKNSGAMWRVLANAVNYGGLPKAILTDCELIVEGPTLIVRDKAQETQRAMMLNQAGRLSGSTWAKWESVDNEQEVKQWQEEKLKEAIFQIQLQKVQAQGQLEVAQMQQQAQMAMAGQQAQAQTAQVQASNPQAQQGQPAPGAPGQAPGGQQPMPGAQAQAMPMQPMVQQDLVATPHSDSGFNSRMGGNVRDLIGLESVSSSDRLRLDSLEDVSTLRRLMESAGVNNAA